MRRLISLFLVCIFIFLFAACDNINVNSDDDNIKIVAAMFAEYDFSKQILGDKGNVTMLMPPGSEIHSYEPTPQDIISIKNADIFIYSGGESEEWLDTILSSVDTNKLKIVSMMEICQLYEEETVEGMESEHKHSEEAEHHDEHETEYDEHVWTSPLNAVKIIETLTETICSIDTDNQRFYRENCVKYVNEIMQLHQKFYDITHNASNKTIVFADRFPFRYFTEEYGINYIAAFPGCSHDSEPSAKTIRYIIDKINNESIPVIFTIENSNKNVAEAISRETGAKILEFHSCHNVTKDDFNSGITYVKLMQRNYNNLKEALR